VISDDILLPGALIGPDDTTANQNVLVDETVHCGDGAALAAIGVGQVPEGDIGPATYGAINRSRGTLDEWLYACRSLYRNTHDNSASWGYLEPVSLTMPKGFTFLTELIGRANARLTARYFERITQGAFSREISFGHSTRSVYQKINVHHPF